MSGVYKQSLDYFPLDTNVFFDNKVCVLAIRQGCKGPCVYFYLLCQCYGDKGYWMEWDSDDDILVEIHAETLKITPRELRQVIEACLNLDLFDRGMYERKHILTSRGIQWRYLQAVHERARKALRRGTVYTVDGDVWLLSEQETREELCAISPPHCSREPSTK